MITPWKQCRECGKIVKINKPIIGSLHYCSRSYEPIEEIICALCGEQIIKHTDTAAGGGYYFTNLSGELHPHAHN